MTAGAITIPGLDAALLRAAERPVRYLARGTRVRHTGTGATGTVVRTEHRAPHAGSPGWRFVVVDAMDPYPHRTAWIDRLVEEASP